MIERQFIYQTGQGADRRPLRLLALPGDLSPALHGLAARFQTQCRDLPSG